MVAASIFTRAKDVFGEVVDLPTDERAARLDALCGDDQALRDEVASLLGHAEEPDERLTAHEGARELFGLLLGEDDPGTDGMGAPAALTGALDTGSRLGGFVLGERLGAGGMGVVFEARQDEPRRTVALKVLAGIGPASPQLIRRFRKEVHVLGRLDHPGIAALYEAGSVDTGDGLRPFYAMQRAEGRPLHHWVRERRPSPRQIGRVMVQVCEAVAHAHGKGVVHRDLKPGNLLVDDEGRPTVLDFGVARLTDSATQLTSMHTEAGSLLGTLPYMSPEQVGGDVDVVDARSDVYALGVVLYEALSGRLPVEVDGLSLPAAALEIQRRDPPRLGTVAPGLSGDLDVLLATALAKEPERRYEHAAALAADLRRWLSGETIAARPPSPLQQAERFVRRHKALAAGTAIAFGALLVALLVSLDQTATTGEALELAVREADRSKVVAGAAALDAGEPLAARQQLDAVTPAGRGWEWHHLHQRLEPWTARLDLGDDVQGLSLASSGEIVATVDGDGGIVRRDATTGEVLSRVAIDVDRPVRWADLTSDLATGFAVVVETAAGEMPERLGAVAFDGRTGAVLARRSVEGEVRGWELDATGPGGAALVWAEGERHVLRWAAGDAPPVTARTVRRLAPSQGLIARAGFVVVLGQFGKLERVDVTGAGTPTLEQRVSGLRIADADVSRDGTRVAVGTQDGAVTVVEAQGLGTLASWPAHRGPTRRVHFLGDGSRLATLGDDATLRVWDVASTRLLAVHMLPQRFARELRADGGGDRVLASDSSGGVLLFDLRRSAVSDELIGHEDYVYDVDVLADDRVISIGWDRSVRVWDPGELRELGRVQVGKEGALIAAAPGLPVALARAGQELWRIDFSRLHGPSLLGRHWFRLRSVQWLPGDHRAVVSRYGRRADDELQRPFEVIDTVSGEVDPTLTPALGQGRAWRHLAIHPAGTTLAVGDRAGRVARLRLSDGAELGAWDLSMEHGHDNLTGMAWSFDGAWLVVSTETGEVLALREGDGERVERVASLPFAVWDATFTPDGTRLALACHDGVVRLLETGSWIQVAALRGHRDYVKGIAFSRDGAFLASASGDGTVRLWHTRPLAERLGDVDADGR